MSERWLPVDEYGGAYEVSNLGRVRSVDRTRLGRNGFPQPIRGRVLNAHRNVGGYQQVRLSLNGKKHGHYVHRLVMAAFVGPCPLGHEVDHIDNKPANNTLSNLRYVTPQENTSAKVARRQQFKCGHPVEGNTYTPRSGVRICHQCQRVRWRRASAKKRSVTGQPQEGRYE